MLRSISRHLKTRRKNRYTCGKNVFFRNGTELAYIYGIRKREFKMRMIEKVISDCCGDEVQGYDFCRCCLEHCTPILEYYPDPTDPEYNENWAIPE